LSRRNVVSRPTLARCLALILVLALAAVTLGAGCSDEAVPHPCTQIPAGGCPLSHGVACDDPTCEAIYLCRPNNVWELSQRCPPRNTDAAAAPIGFFDAGISPQPAPLFDAAFDAPPGAYGGPGCDSLQAPDCAAGVALSCGQGCCGCEDLYVCASGGWTLWGACLDGGAQPGR
jgi:hypothetical protein